ncbi:MAG: AtpZ/AtpI family protein [Firmicutes bacterium]|nr:AtpZ/AtpI family protein [Bacillota bacterium]
MKDIGKAIGMIMQIGISMFVPIFICVLIGVQIDKWADTSPLFLGIFIFLGVGAAFRTLYMMTKDFGNDEKKDK